MRIIVLLPMVILFCFTLSGCVTHMHSVDTSSRYNSQRMDKIKEKYSDKIKTADVQGNTKYRYDNNVLTIDMK